MSTVTVSGTAAPGATVTATVTETKTAVGSPGTVVITTETTVTAAPSPNDSVTDSTTGASTDHAPTTGLTIGAAEGISATTDDGAAEIRVLAVKRVTDAGGEYGEKPKNGNYLLIDVQYTATDGTYNYNPFDWTVRDADGRTYSLSDGGNYQGKINVLHSGTVAKGSKARGIVVVDAPKGALTLELGGGFGNAPATWKIP